MKNIVIFGGGTGISCMLSGLKLFPVDVTAVIAVSDDGSSTGVLKEELDIPAVGDLGKVLLSMANVDEDFVRLLSYRFHRDGAALDNHPVRNILLAALIDLKGDLKEASKYMSNILNIKGTVLPLTEERVELVGHGDGREYLGECEVSMNVKDIDYLSYDREFTVSREILEKIYEADLIILSPGSLYTSIIPHLIAPQIREAIGWSHAPIMYISNLVSQAGETDGFTVSDHVKELNKYLGERKVDVVVANNGSVDEEVEDVYEEAEGKVMLEPDAEAVEALGAELIADDISCVEEGRIRHDELKTAYMVFSYLMR
jgi:uncharacterized cofD-like protein